MRKVICCWCDRTPEDFESNVPLHFSGKRNLSLGFRNDIDVIFLTGYGNLGDAYRGHLQEAGYRLHDLSGVYVELDRHYAALDRFGAYEKKCFLRWPALSAYFQGEPISHFDGDIVFNEDPAVIGRLLAGKTFVLQGCPALTSISDTQWFAQYQEQLALFVSDIQGYSARAWTERTGWEISETGKWAGQRFRKTISSDQDLLSHLIHTDRIIQDRPSEILSALSSYLVFENPMYLHGYENNLHHARYIRIDGIDYIDGRRILIWHMQSFFTNYLSKFILRRDRLKKGLKRLGNDAERKDFDCHVHDFFVKYLDSNLNSRLAIYKYFFEKNDFSEVLTDSTWWQEGAFA